MWESEALRSRPRQTAFAVAGVATGVGFSVMMAALMEGSQPDFMRQLINTLPRSRYRTSAASPAEKVYAAAKTRGLTPQARRKGIKNPLDPDVPTAWVARRSFQSRRSRADVRTGMVAIEASALGTALDHGWWYEREMAFRQIHDDWPVDFACVDRLSDHRSGR